MNPVHAAEAIVRGAALARILRNADFVRRALPADFAAWLHPRRGR